MTKKKLLVVEDTEVCMDLFNFILDRRKYEIFFARNGEDGLRIAQAMQPDLIFLDIMLPRMSGYEVARAIRGKPGLNSTPIIALSARPGEEGEKRALEAGCQEFIYKPFEVLQIREVLHRFLG